MNKSHTVNSPRAIVSASLMSAASVAIFLLTPLIVGRAMESSWQLSAEQASNLPAVYFLGYLSICLSGVLWIRRFNWKKIGILGYGLLIGGVLLCPFTNDIEIVTALFLIAGVGAGILYSLSTCAVADTRFPDRNFGIKIVAEQLLGASLMLTLPMLLSNSFQSLMMGLGCVLTALAISVVWLPAIGRDMSPNSSGVTTQRHNYSRMLIGLVSLLIFFGGLSGYWAFIERVADTRGLSQSDIGQALSLGIIGGGVGALSAAVVGGRFGNLIPMLLCALLLAIALWLLSLPFAFWQFAATAFLLSGAWNLSLVYQLAAAAEMDVDGRLTPLISASLAAGAMLGPLAAGSLLTNYGDDPNSGFNALAFMAMGCVIIALGLFTFLKLATLTKGQANTTPL
ncbi:MAG: MFS transporter [Halioglobus sp.]